MNEIIFTIRIWDSGSSDLLTVPPQTSNYSCFLCTLSLQYRTTGYSSSLHIVNMIRILVSRLCFLYLFCIVWLIHHMDAFKPWLHYTILDSVQVATPFSWKGLHSERCKLHSQKYVFSFADLLLLIAKSDLHYPLRFSLGLVKNRCEYWTGLTSSDVKPDW